MTSSSAAIHTIVDVLLTSSMETLHVFEAAVDYLPSEYTGNLRFRLYALIVLLLVRLSAYSRHARFGGTLQVGGGNGTAARMVANPFKDRVDCVPQASRKKTKRGKTFTVDDVSSNSSGLSER